MVPNSHAGSAAPILSNIWNFAAGDTPYITTGTTERGIAVSRLTGNILIASRAGGTFVKVLNGQSGVLQGDMNTTGISGGTFALSHIRSADDGVIYAANLSVAASTGFRVYRWDTEDTNNTLVSVRVFGPDAAGTTQTLDNTLRWGDSFDLRGAGTNTQMAVSGSANTKLAILTTTDGTNFTGEEFSLASVGGSGAAAFGISFYTNNTLLIKNNTSTSLRIVSFNLATTNLSLVTTLTVDTSLSGLKMDLTNNALVAVVTPNSATTANHHFKVFDFNASPPTIILDTNMPTPTAANINGTGAADNNSSIYVGLESLNGVRAYKVIGFATNNPPGVIASPQDVAILQGGYTTFTVSASGTPPLKYQWQLYGTNLPGQTNLTLNLTNIQNSSAGPYSVAITNTYGFALSATGNLTVLPAVLTTAMVPIWTKSVGDLFFLGNDNNHRGLGYNAPSNHLVIVSRTPSNGVHVVDAATGNYIRSLDTSGVTGAGTFVVNLCGVADDGAVYVANLDTVGTAYEIYRWADDGAATVASVAYGASDPCGCGRLGDTLAVRGAGTNTQILISSRNGTQVVLFTTTDGVAFTPNVIDVNSQPATFAGLGVAFGAGNTFWGKTSGFQYRHIVYDLVNGTNGLLETFAAGQTNDCALGVDPVNDLVAGITPNTNPGTPRAQPDQVNLYDVHGVVTGTAGEPPLIDQDYFKTSNQNGNGTGAVVFDVNGGRLFALDSNNGILAVKVVARLFQNPSPPNTTYTWTGPSVLQSSLNVTGTYNDLPGAPASGFSTNSSSGTRFFRLRR
jgi:hypothetical protein